MCWKRKEGEELPQYEEEGRVGGGGGGGRGGGGGKEEFVIFENRQSGYFIIPKPGIL